MTMDFNWMQAGMAIVTASVGAFVPFWLNRISAKIDAKEEERRAEAQKQAEFFKLINEALKCVIRDRLLQARRYFVRQGYIPAQEFENISNLYKSYEKLGGNDLGHRAYEEIKTLPFEPPEDANNE